MSSILMTLMPLSLLLLAANGTLTMDYGWEINWQLVFIKSGTDREREGGRGRGRRERERERRRERIRIHTTQ